MKTVWPKPQAACTAVSRFSVCCEQSVTLLSAEACISFTRHLAVSSMY